MSDDKKRKIIEEYLKTATDEERRELNRLLKSRKCSENNGLVRQGLNVDIKKNAKIMAEEINQQFGLTEQNIKKMARNLVAQMVLQHKPDISSGELTTVVNQMLQAGSNKPEKLPKELLKTMIVQFVSYSSGEMTAEGKARLPKGWVEKYWGYFPDDVKHLIKSYLKNGIDGRKFWLEVERLIK